MHPEEDFLGTQLWYLRFCGVIRKDTAFHTFRRRCVFGTVFLFIILQMIFVGLHVKEFAKICDAIPTLIISAFSFSKCHAFVFHSRDLFALSDAFKVLQQHTTAKDEALFERNNRFHAKLTHMYMVLALIVGCFYVASSIVQEISLSRVEGHVVFVTPMAFPHNYQHPVVYVVSFLFSCDAMLMGIFINGSVDASFSELATSVRIHFGLIQDRFRSLDFTVADAETHLKATVEYHEDVLGQCRVLTGRYQYVVFSLLLLDSVLLCVIGYQFVIFMNTPRVIMLVAMAFVMILQAVIYCYHGSTIYDESLSVADAIYQSNWYEARPAVQRRVRLCMTRAQQPVVTKGGFMKATLPMLKKMLSSTGSYITMLLSFEAEEP
ncbi:odorant receptor 82a-like [Anopheles nili]|uniref:odorant receptor 82a-like n=1 Tax=Anopheles nili TaxID=185578 RepID=UPI00237B42AE|nr:odorant receptor 82a-like [Anopheles nili]